MVTSIYASLVTIDSGKQVIEFAQKGFYRCNSCKSRILRENAIRTTDRHLTCPICKKNGSLRLPKPYQYITHDRCTKCSVWYPKSDALRCPDCHYRLRKKAKRYKTPQARAKHAANQRRYMKQK